MAPLENDFYITGGTLRPDAPSYLERQADRELLEGLRQGEFCYVLTSRQMGKSSLMVRTANKLREQGATVVVLDLTAIGQNLAPEQWYGGLLNRLARQVRLEDELDEFWWAHAHLGPCQRFFTALEQLVLPKLPEQAQEKRLIAKDGPAHGPQVEIDVASRTLARHPTPSIPLLVIFVDELDVVRSLPFSTDEFFAAIRECYTRRTEDRGFDRLTFCLLGVATPSELIRDARLTPFNIGRRIELKDFKPEETGPLAFGLEGCETVGRGTEKGVTPALLKRILHWTHGHPYLTQRLCRAVAQDLSQRPNGESHRSGWTVSAASALVDRWCEELFLSPRARERDDNLLFVRERLRCSEVDQAALLCLYSRIHARERVRDDETSEVINQLCLSGIVRVEKGNLRVRNRIYSRVFDAAWIRAVMPPPSGTGVRAIAVLPFVNMSPGSESEYLSDGITEDLIIALSRVKQLKVAARSSTFAFKGKTKDIRKIGERLGVAFAVEGSVRKIEDKVRVTAQLIDVADGCHLWSETYDHRMQEMLSLQEQISRSIVSALNLEMPDLGELSWGRAQTTNPEAYQLYLKGRYYWNQRGLGLQKGLYYFELARLEDPNYALAYAGIADTYNVMAWFYGPLSPGEAVPKAKAAALQALALDGQLAEAHAALAFSHFIYDWDWAAAEREFNRALELNPHYLPTYYSYAMYLAAMGQSNKAIDTAEKALALDPLSANGHNYMAFVMLLSGDYDRAVEHASRALELNPNYVAALWQVGQAYLAKAKSEEAAEAFKKGVDLSNRMPLLIASLGVALAETAQKGKLREILTELQHRSAREPVRSYFFALLFCSLGLTDKCLDHLEKAYDERDCWLTWLHLQPIFKPLHSSLRFATLVNKVLHKTAAEE